MMRLMWAALRSVVSVRLVCWAETWAPVDGGEKAALRAAVLPYLQHYTNVICPARQVAAIKMKTR